MENEEFVGNWELIRWTTELNDGTLAFPFGEDAVGRITYENNGQMSVNLMKTHRHKFHSEDPLQAKPDEVVKAYNEFLAYCGNYEVYVNSNQVVHQIKLSSFPNWVDQNQIRKYEFKEDKLILSTDTIGSGRHKLIWQKMKNKD
jgi:hypothetical protein